MTVDTSEWVGEKSPGWRWSAGVSESEIGNRFGQRWTRAREEVQHGTEPQWGMWMVSEHLGHAAPVMRVLKDVVWVGTFQNPPVRIQGTF